MFIQDTTSFQQQLNALTEQALQSQVSCLLDPHNLFLKAVFPEGFFYIRLRWCVLPLQIFLYEKQTVWVKAA